MYKIMYKISTSKNNTYGFYGRENTDGTITEYSYGSEDDVKEAAKKIVKDYGLENIKIVDDKDYYLQLIYGEEPSPTQILYSVNFSTENSGITIEKPFITDIVVNGTASTNISFETEPKSFHFIIDNVDYSSGIPDWIIYSPVNNLKGTSTVTNITKNHDIKIVLD